MIDVLMPYGEPDLTNTPDTPVAPRLDSLQGATVGIVNNGWHCMDLLTEEARAALLTDYGVSDVVEVNISAAQTLPPEKLSLLVDSCDAVVVGIGTCGSCSRWVLQDAMDLERLGVPTVSLFTKVFEPLARSVRVSDGMPGLPLAILPHPLNPLPEDEIRTASRAVMPEIAGALSKGLVLVA
jgi:hypothetical protein